MRFFNDDFKIYPNISTSSKIVRRYQQSIIVYEPRRERPPLPGAPPGSAKLNPCGDGAPRSVGRWATLLTAQRRGFLLIMV